jgi:glycerol uptake facilitator-like aquaporin
MTHAVFAWIGQIVGGVMGATIVYGIASGRDGWERSQFAANLWSGPYAGLGSTIVVEVVLTALLVLVVLATTGRRFPVGMGGLVAGITLALIHLISIPVDNTSVNPVRSFGSALFAGASAWEQLWAFIVFPLMGSLVGVLIWLFVHDDRLEDTMLDSGALRGVRDQAEDYLDRAVDAVDGDAVDGDAVDGDAGTPRGNHPS